MSTTALTAKPKKAKPVMARLPGMGDKLDAIRIQVRGHANILMKANKRRLNISAENVDVLEGITFPAAKLENVELEACVFLCGTVCMHVDRMVPRWNTLVYLGTLDGDVKKADIKHVLHALNPGQEWHKKNTDLSFTFLDNGTHPSSLGGTEYVLKLTQGDVITLDVSMPHWMQARAGDEEVGGIESGCDVPGKTHPSLKGINLPSITGMFLAVASDKGYVTGKKLERLVDSMVISA